MKKNNKGFTLMEMLIVVAIIAILVAIAIPVFTAQLEKAREATDLANIRSAYAEVLAAFLTGETDLTKTVTLTQKQDDWQTSTTDLKIGEYKVSTESGLCSPKASGTMKLAVDNDPTSDTYGVITFTAAAAG